MLKLDGPDDPGLKEGPSEGVYIHGLFLEGCAWSKKENKLIDSAPKQLFAMLPIMYVTAALSSEVKGNKNQYNSPCYRNKKRGMPTCHANSTANAMHTHAYKSAICTPVACGTDGCINPS